MAAIRIGVVGCGGIAGHHLDVLKGDEFAGMDVVVTAYCDVNRKNALAARDKFGGGDEFVSDDCLETLDSGKVDAVLISSPHTHHAEAAIAAFERGIHVLLEKPVAITVGEARRINNAHRESSSLYTVHFQRRHTPTSRWVKKQIDSGLIGSLQKASVAWTDWYRTQKYYDRAGWRGTWSGDGGGVMMNQCPHDLDLFTWWLGLPERVNATLWLGRRHNIEVEDEVVANLAFPGGGVGIINASTCDAPGVTRWDIIGDEGAIFISDGNVRAFRHKENLGAYTQSSDEIFRPPESTEITPDLNADSRPNETIGVWTNFLRAIRGEEKLFMDGTEGVRSLELANAIIASGYLGRPVNIPLDAELYKGILANLTAGKTGAAILPDPQD